MRKRFSIPTKSNSTFTLNITSMTDMFTILLVFLLQSYSANQVEIKLNEKVRLPNSTSELNPTDGPQLSISKDELIFNDKTIIKLSNSRINSKDLSSDDDQFIDSLFQALQVETTKKPDQKTGQILLQADKEVPYSELKKVLYTASMAGYPNVKLVTQLGR